MKKDNIYGTLEFFITLLLYLALLFLYSGLLRGFEIYLAFFLAASFAVSYYSKDRFSSALNFIMAFAAFGVLAWAVYSLMNSVFLYKEIILLCVKVGFLLAVVLGLAATRYPYIIYCQIITVILFWCLPVFMARFSLRFIILSLFFLVGWVALLKAKFLRNLGTRKTSFSGNGISYLPTGIIVAAGLFIAFIALTISTRNQLIIKGFLDSGQRYSDITSEGVARKYRRLQDAFQENMLTAIHNSTSTERAREALGFTEKLMNDSQDSMEVDSASRGLISLLQSPGLGLKQADSEENITLTKEYVNAKAEFNIQQAKEEISGALKNNPLNIIDRFSIYFPVNRIQESDTPGQVSENAAQARDKIRESSLDEYSKQKMLESVDKLREWKDYQLYRKKVNELQEKIDSEKGLAKDLAKAIDGVNNIQGISELEQVEEQVNKLSDSLMPGQEALIREISEALSLKADMLIFEQSQDLQEQLDDSDAALIQESGTLEELVQNADKVLENIDTALINEELKQQIIDYIDEIKELRMYQLYKMKIEQIGRMINSGYAQAGKDFASTQSMIETAMLASDLDKAKSGIKNLSASADSSQKQLIKEMKDALALKTDMLMAQKSRAIKKELKGKGLSKSRSLQARKRLASVSRSADAAALKGSVSDLQKALDSAGTGRQSAGLNSAAIPEAAGVPGASSTSTSGASVSGAIVSQIPGQGEGTNESMRVGGAGLSGTDAGLTGGAGTSTGAGSGGGDAAGEGDSPSSDEEDEGPLSLDEPPDIEEQILPAKQQELKDLAQIEISRKSGAIKEEINKALAEGSASAAGQDFLGKLDELSQSDYLQKLQQKTGNLEKALDQLYENGLIDQQTRQILSKKIKELRDYLVLKIAKKPKTTARAVLKRKQLLSIKVTPAYTAIPLGEKVQLKAFGVLIDRSEIDLSYAVKWSVSDERIAGVSLGEVSSFSTGSVKAYAQLSGVKSNYADIIIEDAKLLSIVISPQQAKISMIEGMDMKAEGRFTDGSIRNLTALVSWELSKQGVASIKKGRVSPFMAGVTEVIARHEGVASLPARIEVVFSWLWLALISVKLAVLCLVILSGVLFALYLLTLQEKDRLRILLKNDPKRFVIDLFGNFKKVLSVMQVENTDSLAPLKFASLIEGRYSIKEERFIRLTEKFEKANFSRHSFEEAEAEVVLRDYNILVKEMLASRKGLKRIFTNFAALWRRAPFVV